MSLRSVSPTPLAGLLLAGGRSSRMGRDKALLDWHGEPLLQRMRALLQAVGAAPIHISGDYPEFGGVADCWPGLGPLGGLATLAPWLPDGDLLILPIDMPRLDVGSLRPLLDATAAAAVHYRDLPLPLRLRLDARSRADIAEALARPQRQRSLQALIERLEGHALAWPAAAETRLLNCNTPEEYRAALA